MEEHLPSRSPAGFFFGFVLLALTAACTVEVTPPAAPLTPEPTPGPVRVDELRRPLYGVDDQARLAAIAQLQAIGTPEAVGLLGEFFMFANLPGRTDAARAMLAIDGPEATAFFRAAMADRKLTARRQVAMQALEYYKDASFPMLREFLRDPDETVRLNTVYVLEFMQSARARFLLQIALKDKSLSVQSAAEQALRRMGYAVPDHF